MLPLWMQARAVEQGLDAMSDPTQHCFLRLRDLLRCRMKEWASLTMETRRLSEFEYQSLSECPPDHKTRSRLASEVGMQKTLRFGAWCDWLDQYPK
jgi:hypothetical protein